ncbi:rhombotin-1 isoform X1 [Melozone crissalis]|uniref:rhombotin-1 isoform X1 n=1 Tax=Melozone crissalis TaxID=40204 RepID=UPI0023DBC595|nr:rhombotin-1 isoform X1 [Melozone crissalis]
MPGSRDKWEMLSFAVVFFFFFFPLSSTSFPPPSPCLLIWSFCLRTGRACPPRHRRVGRARRAVPGRRVRASGRVGGGRSADSRQGKCSLLRRGVPMLSVQPKGKQKGCAGCNRKIKDRYLLKALDKYWHEDCLKCACCDCRLGEVGSTLYTKANLILCRRDYLRLFGTTGNCAACSKLIPAFEMVMRARDNVYHLDCFACQLCNQRFCVGDKFFLKNNMILCQMDYEEGQLNGSFESQVQ